MSRRFLAGTGAPWPLPGGVILGVCGLVSCAVSPVAPPPATRGAAPTTGDATAPRASRPIEPLAPLGPISPVAPVEARHDPWSARKDLISVPSDPSPAQWSWPEQTSFALANGLSGQVLRKRDVSVVAVALRVPAGEVNAPVAAKGAAALLAGWLRAGSGAGQRPLELRVEELGATVSMEADRFGLTLSCQAMVSVWPGCLSLLSDLARAPALGPEALRLVRAQRVAALRAELASPAGRARSLLDNLLWGDEHPVGTPVTPEDVERTTEAAIRTFWSTWFVPNLAELVVSGNVDPIDVQRAADRAFGSWRRGRAPTRKRAGPLPEKRLRIVLVDLPSAPTSTIVFGQALGRATPRQLAALSALAFVYGGSGMGSRLALDVSTRGLITAGGATVDEELQSVLLRGQVEAPVDRTWDALLASAEQLASLRAHGLTPLELTEAKARSSALDPFRLESAAGLAEAAARSSLGAGGGLSDFEVLANATASLTHAEVVKEAQRFDPERLAVVIVGPATRIAPQLQTAKVRFELVGPNDPLSAGERARRRALMAAPADDARTATARALVIRALAAQGGAPAWRAIETLKVVKQGERLGAGSAASLTSTTSYRRPGHVRVEQSARSGDQVARGGFVMTPDRVLALDDQGKPAPLPEDNAARLRAAVFEDVTFLLLNLLDAKPALPMQPTEPLRDGGLELPGLLVRVPSGQWLRLYFDPKTNLLARIRTAEGDMNEQRLGDWRAVNGGPLKLPFLQSSAGDGASVAKVIDVQVNPTFAPDLFP